MNVLIGAVSGMGASALTKESLSAAAEEMRRISIKNSKLFEGVVDNEDSETILTNLPNEKSEGVRGDGIKLGGTRVDLDLLCGADNSRCKTNADGSLALTETGQVQWNREGAEGKSLEQWLNESFDAKKMYGPTGGIQGWKGTLFGEPYLAGSWQDKLIEAFSGTHDLFGGQITGLYDDKGNIKRGMSSSERTGYDVWSGAAILPSAPFAMSELLPPEMWKAISIFIKAAK